MAIESRLNARINTNVSHISENGVKKKSNTIQTTQLAQGYRTLRFAKEEAWNDEETPEPVKIVPWRMRDRMKTMDVALVLCLNIGTDPPDVVRPTPCARKECWVDPFSLPVPKALEIIGKTLQAQYERWQPRAKYRQSLDPTVDDTRHLCASLRRHAKHDRVLFHYNGHGVPRPTANGEIWVFNKSYTQYIPLLVFDLQSWVGTPSIYVFDCSAAGILLSHFNNGETPPTPSGEAIVLAACGADELIPMNPELCADVFTACLTTPITIALRWFISQNQLSMSHIDVSFIAKIPGTVADRKTPLGELNWIFTAITDTIAWNVLPPALFQKLFRQDLLVAAFFRNFLLAERIMKSLGCSPCSLPALPQTHHHPLWKSWDLAAETCLSQLSRKLSMTGFSSRELTLSFQPSHFFSEQLTAFEVWLQFGSSSKAPPQQLATVLQALLSQEHRLRALILLKNFLDLGPWAVNQALSVGIFPYVLKILHAPASDLRQVLVYIWSNILALDARCQVELVKDNGHIHFVSHLASGLSNAGGHSNTTSSVQHNVNGSQKSLNPPLPSQQKVMAAFILSVICDNYPPGQSGCVSQQLIQICKQLLSEDASSKTRKWVALCLSKLWENYDDAKVIAIKEGVPKVLSSRLHDKKPEVRAAVAVAFGTLLKASTSASMNNTATPLNRPLHYQTLSMGGRNIYEHPDISRMHTDLIIASELLWGCEDASPLVRRESVLALATIVLHPFHQPRFACVARHTTNRSLSRKSDADIGELSGRKLPTIKWVYERFGREGDRPFPVGLDLGDVPPELSETLGNDANYYIQIWSTLKAMQTNDPFPSVVNAVKCIVSHVNTALLPTTEVHKKPPNNGESFSTDEVSHLKDGTSSRINGDGNIDRLQRQSSSSAYDNSSFREKKLSMPALQELSQHNHQTTRVPEDRYRQDMRRQRDVEAGHYLESHTDHEVMEQSMPGLGGSSGAEDRQRGMRSSQSVDNFSGVYRQEHVRSISSRETSSANETIPRVNGLIRGQANQHRHIEQNQGEASSRLRLPSNNNANLSGQPSSQSLFSNTTSDATNRTEFPDILQSKFYDRQKVEFQKPRLEPSQDRNDPLSTQGAQKWERQRRYAPIQAGAADLAPGFSLPYLEDSDILSSSFSSNDTLSNPVDRAFQASASSYTTTTSSYAYSYGSVSSSNVGVHGDRDEVKNFKMNLRQRAVLHNDADMTSLLLFHPYETGLIVADDKDQIAIYNIEVSEKRLLTFQNENPYGTRLTALSWINESEESLLMTASDDGVIKIYHGLHQFHANLHPPKLLTGFVAVPDLVPGTRGSGMVTQWQQNASMLYTGGNSSILRGWNLHHERCVFRLPTRTDACVSSMASDESTGGILVTGYGDGSLRLFDPRLPTERAMLASMREHTSWVVQTHVYQRRNELLTGSVSGELKFWDLRYAKSSVKSLEALRSPMTALAVHDYAPILASGSHNQFIKVLRTDGEQLALIRYHEGFLGERIGPVSCLAFHPRRLILAAGATDSVVAVYSSDK